MRCCVGGWFGCVVMWCDRSFGRDMLMVWSLLLTTGWRGEGENECVMMPFWGIRGL